MPPAGFKPEIPASEQPETHALDRAATGIDVCVCVCVCVCVWTLFPAPPFFLFVLWFVPQK